MILVDTNIFIYSADEHSPFHTTCKKWIEDLRNGEESWCSSWPIVYELLRVITHPRVLRRPWTAPAAFEFVELLVQTPGFNMLTATDAHVRVARATIREIPEACGNLMHDLHKIVLMREHGIHRIATHDKDFVRFHGIDVIDPVRE